MEKELIRKPRLSGQLHGRVIFGGIKKEFTYTGSNIRRSVFWSWFIIAGDMYSRGFCLLFRLLVQRMDRTD